MPGRDDREGPVPRSVARFNRRIANRVVRPVAGWLPPLAVVRHRGRRTGREYATPVLAVGTADGLVVGVLYGTDSDWVRNLLASGHAQVTRRGSARDYDHPRLVDRDEGLRLLPAPLRVPFRVLGVQHLLRLTVRGPDEPAA